MSHLNCCVINCKNTGRNSSECKFYRFPTASHKLEQRRKWIAAVRRKNIDGSPWIPKQSDYICSAHFIGNKKREEENSPSYVPTIFPFNNDKNLKNKITALKRHERFMKRRMQVNKKIVIKQKQFCEEPVEELIELNNCNGEHFQIEGNVDKKITVDQECQVNIFCNNDSQPEKVFICNRLSYKGECISDAETQINIVEYSTVSIIQNRKQFKDKQCGTQICFADKCVGFDAASDEPVHKGFTGISSIKKNEELLDLAGVTFETFNCLLSGINSTLENRKISKENKLLIFLFKMKTGLTFSAISVLFCVHRTTISRIFFTILRDLSSATMNAVFWPRKTVVIRTMPECFKPDYCNTRVIIDCTEFNIEMPSSVDNRILSYSNYKKGFTAKLLIGITPGGFISFKSKVAGGRMSDSQLTVKSGLLDLLEEGDIVLADKGFPQIKQILDEKGKNVTLVMPPFLEKKTAFTKKETEDTYKIAQVRIHVERIMQRLRTYNILNKIPENLFSSIDDIVHMCCVLVNLQAPIISQTAILNE